MRRTTYRTWILVAAIAAVVGCNTESTKTTSDGAPSSAAASAAPAISDQDVSDAYI